MRRTLTILQLNDLHGYIEPHRELVRDGGEWTFVELGGLARIATLFDRVRRETEGAVIALDNGDTFHGTHVAVASRGHALVPMMNALKMDAMTVHWEFAYTPGACVNSPRNSNIPSWRSTAIGRTMVTCTSRRGGLSNVAACALESSA